MPADRALVGAVMAATMAKLAQVPHRPLVVGLCGAQGSGKSTLAEALADDLTGAGVAAAILSLDDLYTTRGERVAMAREVHPLFRTRGVPGTHDLALGMEVLAALRRGKATPLPRFDKATDDRAPRDRWPTAPAGTQVLILEGWFVGARPQPDDALAAPVNALERDEDADGVWRRAANARLADYATLFGAIDLLILLAAPSFEVVRGWRTEQEHSLRERTGGGMSDAAIGRFVAHYERLTRHILEDMPGYADVVVRLGVDRGVDSLVC